MKNLRVRAALIGLCCSLATSGGPADAGSVSYAVAEGVVHDLVAGFVPLSKPGKGIVAWAGLIAQSGATLDNDGQPRARMTLILCRTARPCDAAREISPDLTRMDPAEATETGHSSFYGTDPDFGNIDVTWGAVNDAQTDSRGACNHRWSRYSRSTPDAGLFHDVIGVRAPKARSGMFVGAIKVQIGELRIPPRFLLLGSYFMHCGFVVRDAWADVFMSMTQPRFAMRRST